MYFVEIQTPNQDVLFSGFETDYFETTLWELLLDILSPKDETFVKSLKSSPKLKQYLEEVQASEGFNKLEICEPLPSLFNQKFIGTNQIYLLTPKMFKNIFPQSKDISINIKHKKNRD